MAELDPRALEAAVVSLREKTKLDADDATGVAEIVLNAYLSASSPQEAALGAVGVKKLEWREAPDEMGRHGWRFIGTPAVGLSYVVTVMVHGQKGERWELANRAGDYATLDEAKAAAQADFDARIRSALTVLPSGQNETGGEIVLPIQMQERYYGSEIQAMLDELNAGRSPASGERNAVVEALAEVERVRPGAFWILGKGRTKATEPLFGFQILFGTDEVLASGEGATEVEAINAAIRALKETPNA